MWTAKGFGSSQPNFTPSSVGLYYWQAFYGGDGNNEAVKSACSAEVLEVEASLGTISTTPSASVITLGESVWDYAILSGVAPTAGGSIIFKLFGPGDPTCSGAPVFTSAQIDVNGLGQYGPSDSFKTGGCWPL